MRKAQAKKLPLAPDARYNDKQVTRFVNNMMEQGKKGVAFEIFYNALERVEMIQPFANHCQSLIPFPNFDADRALTDARQHHLSVQNSGH